MHQLVSTIIMQQASFWEGFVRAFDIFGLMGPRVDWNADPCAVDREAIRSDWEQTRLDMMQAQRDLMGGPLR